MSGIFISYRRSTSQHFARSIFNALQQRGHDVFLDVNSIDSGAFDGIIRNQIAARPHFLLILSKGALERCVNTDDWLLKEIQEAISLNRNIVPVYDEGFNFNDEKHFLPESLQDFLSKQNAPPFYHYYFNAFIETLSDRFFKQNIDNLPVTPTPPAERAEVQKRIEQAAQPNDVESSHFEYELVPPTPSHPQMWGVENILPQPFEWVYIPPGNVTINNQTFSVDVFNIAKYPITNAQFEVFVQAEDGYRNSKWWDFSKRSRLWREKNQISESRAFPPNDHPRANVNRYEAIAFGNWLGERFNSHAPELSLIKITLPTEQQWQRAALDDGLRLFPWGDNYDSSHGNTKASEIEGTTPVNQYPKGASLYGVIDTFGNVSEWCLNTEEMSGNDIAAKFGGSWKSDMKNNDLWLPSSSYADDIGFRIVMMNS